MRPILIPLALTLSLAACGGQFPNPFKKPDAPAEAAPDTGAPLDAIGTTDVAATPAPRPVEIGSEGQSAASLDTTTAAEKAQATAAPAGAATLGTTVASLGDVTQPGFWLRTPLVDAEVEGTIETEGGAVVAVTLIPLDGPPTAGSQISLSAMRALDLGLTDLPTLTVARS
ncbi:hypothetical protein C8N43_1244 [Litoreibacter ponti]|uniref:D-galactarate dehydratase n=1 Tax=Litoreibacter ponti TaxID=1510457 RepID=A0A2T6BKK1_9RHOB|nr:hypothetical protein [Litoreibacter ponti]PTX56584.1 hypothetical protein C8N43_1244 [Litoreibacter ponti]